MTVEELRNFLNIVMEENPESKDKEVKILYWDKDETFDDYKELLRNKVYFSALKKNLDIQNFSAYN